MTRNALIFALALTLSVLASAVVAGQEFERTSDDQTAWWWYTGVSINTLSSAVNEHGARLIDLEVDSASPLRLSASMVRNTGSYASGWWWYVGIDGTQLSEILDDLSARILDIEVYEVGGALRYAVILVPNTGAQAKGWWWLANVSFNDLSTFVSRNNARILDLEAIEVNGQTTYAAVLVRNTGSDAAAWWWYVGVSLDDLDNALSANSARVLDLERLSNGRYAVVAVRPQGEAWWWYVGLDGTGVAERIQLTGARVVDIERYSQSGQARYAVVLTGNAEDAGTTVGIILDKDTDGAFGYYLKEFNGPVLTSFHEDQTFYPASTIKALVLLYTIAQVPNPAALGSTLATLYSIASESCLDVHPNTHTSSQQTLRWLADQMMGPSNNQTTNALIEYAGSGFGPTGQLLINSYATSVVGLSQASVLNHKLGCNGPSSSPANTMTLTDIGQMYEQAIAGGILTVDQVAEFHDIMLNETSSFPSSVRAVIEEEAAAMNKSDLVEAFIDEILFAQKGGNIDTSYLSIGGWIELPFGLATTSTTTSSSSTTATGSIASSSATSTSSSVVASTEEAYARVSERLRHKNRSTDAGSLPNLSLAADAYDRRAFTFGLFVDNASTIDENGDGSPLSLFNLMAELLRDQIRAALSSW